MRDPLHWMPVRVKLPLLVAGVCLLAFGVGGTIVSSSARNAIEAEILRRLDAECRSHAEALDHALTLLTRRAQDFASDGYIRDRLERVGQPEGAAEANAAVALTELADYLARNKLPLVAAFRDLAVLDAGGKVLVAVHAPKEAVAAMAPAFASADELPSHSGLREPDRVIDAQHVVIAVPIRDLAGTRELGRLLAFVSFDGWLAAAATRIGGAVGADPAAPGAPPTAAALHLVDPAGRRANVEVPVSAPPRRAPGTRPLLARALRLEINGWTLHSEVDAATALAPVTGLQSRFLLVGAVLAALSGALLFFPMRFLVAPLAALQRASIRIAEGDLAARVPVESSDETGAMATAFNSMAEALGDRARRIAEAGAALARSKRDLVIERDRLNAVIASMRDALIVVGPAGDVVLRNAAAAPLLPALLDPARRPALVSHHRCSRSDGAAPLDGGVKGCAACLLHPGAGSRSCLVDVGGATFEVHAVPVAAAVDEPPGRLLVARDVTERIEQDERQIHHERLSALGEVAAVMAHELNNPLAAICLFQQLLDGALPADSPHKEAVERIGRNAETCRRTIRELLDYTTGASSEVGEVALHSALEAAARFVRPLCKRAQVDVELSLADADPVVIGDEVQVRQLFVNLVMNALQAIASGGRGGRVTLASRVDGGRAEVDVVDDGPGVPASAQPRLFQPFFTTKPRGEGTGLGLATARRIAELHGGRLELQETRPGRTVFRASFRVAVPAGRPIGVAP